MIGGPRLTTNPPAVAKASTTYTGPYPYGSIRRAGSPGLSTTEAGKYTQRHVSFLLSFRRAEHGSLFLLVHAGPGLKPQVRPLQSSVPAGPGPKPQVSPLQSLVPAGPRPKPQVRPVQSLVPASFGSQPQSRPLQSLVPAGSIQKESEEELLEILQAYQATTKSTRRIPLELFREETMPKCRQHCCSTSCKGAREKASTTLRSAGLHTPYSFGVNGSKRSRRTQVPTTIHPKGKAKPLDTTTRKEGGDALSVNPQGYTHQQLPSTCPWQRRFKTRRRVIEWRPENAESGSPKGKQRAGWTLKDIVKR
uniref:Uncharacterized protein n=1 Tax=Brassica oleracea TaxID=3712 RepID=A0A3P6BJD3_BRAOL|nr:unnamed protein product [Brassica oleracea]